MTTIALVDDHRLLRQGLNSLLSKNKNYKVVLEAANGAEFYRQLKNSEAPDIAVIDINMPVMNGFETAEIIARDYPSIKFVGLSFLFDDDVISRMIYLGASGFINKSADEELFLKAIAIVAEGNYFIQSLSGVKVYSSVKHLYKLKQASIDLSSKEKHFLALCASDKSYKEIAGEMGVKARTVDNYRDSLFTKLDVKSRSGLILYAVKNGIVNI